MLNGSFYTARKNLPSHCPGQVGFPAGQGIRKVVCQLSHKKSKLRLAQGKQYLKPSCPKGKLEFSFFSIPVFTGVTLFDIFVQIKSERLMYHAELTKHAKVVSHTNIAKLTNFYKEMYAIHFFVAIGNFEVPYFHNFTTGSYECVITKFNYCYCVALVKRSIEIAFLEHFYLLSAAYWLQYLSSHPKRGCW